MVFFIVAMLGFLLLSMITLFQRVIKKSEMGDEAIILKGSLFNSPFISGLLPLVLAVKEAYEVQQKESFGNYSQYIIVFWLLISISSFIAGFMIRKQGFYEYGFISETGVFTWDQVLYYSIGDKECSFKIKGKILFFDHEYEVTLKKIPDNEEVKAFLEDKLKLHKEVNR